MQKMRGFQVSADARLTKDPELRYTKGGKPVCNLRLCATYAYKQGDGKFKETPSFLNAVIWGPRAEKQAEALKKGALVSVEGRVQSRSWKNKEQQTRSTVDLIVTGITLRALAKGSAPTDGVNAGEPTDIPEEDIPSDEEIEAEGSDSN